MNELFKSESTMIDSFLINRGLKGMDLIEKNPSQSNKLTAQDWLDIAESELAKSGITAVRVEPLAKKLKVTKGSFYWHFSSRKELFEKLLSNWRTRSTVSIIERLSDIELSPEERLRKLFLIPYKRNTKTNGAALELAIRNWSQNDKAVREILNEVDTHRLTFIAMIFENLGYDKEQAEIRAARFYYTMQGISVVNVHKEQASIEQIFETLL